MRALDGDRFFSSPLPRAAIDLFRVIENYSRLEGSTGGELMAFVMNEQNRIALNSSRIQSKALLKTLIQWKRLAETSHGDARDS